jgi:hypothetical protein
LQSIFEIFGTQEINFFVKDENDKINYLQNGAKYVFITGSLINSRNKALEFAFSTGDICVQVSDDLKKIEFNDFTGIRTKKYAQVIDVIENIIPMFLESQYYLCGFPPTSNPYFAMKKEDNGKFIVGDFIIVKPCQILFDTNLRLKEDYDYTLQHIKEYGGCVRYGYFLNEFIHYSNKGGAVSYRDDNLEIDTIKYLQNKWGLDIIKLNTKRKNEILLNRDAHKILRNTIKQTQIELF